MSLSYLIRYAFSLSPGKAARDGSRWLAKRVRGTVGGWSNAGRDTFGLPVHLELARLTQALDADALASRRAIIDGLAAKATAHEFDLLGSGPVVVGHGMDCAGFDGYRYPSTPAGDPSVDGLVARLSPGNRARARTLRDMISSDYRPIDWQIDFKSGYRWREGQWSAAAPFGHLPGVDIKVPWELGRLQHLVHLALAFAAAPDEGAGYAGEFRDQVLDFLAGNPPGFGVNWACTMDAAIRAANLVLARDMLIAHGADLDDAFAAEFAAALVAHGRFIASHLEWKPVGRGNHYLADVVGLLFVAAVLPSDPETDCWLAFAVRAVLDEIADQFADDGSNIEASTAYHRLSAEMAIYACALIRGLPADKVAALAGYDHRRWHHQPSQAPGPVVATPLPAAVQDRLERMVDFVMHVTKPTGRVAQIGDTDNGRLFKLCPLFDGAGIEDHLDHRALAAAGAGLFDRPDFAAFAGADVVLETHVVAALAGGDRLTADRPAPARAVAQHDASAASVDDDGTETVTVIAVPDEAALTDLETVAYPDFGLYIWRGSRFFLSVRCGRLHPDLQGGHAHNDQLAVELAIDDVDWLADPGSGVYTASPRIRDTYRSALAHAVPRRAENEPAPLDGGYFRLADQARAECLAFDGNGFHGVHWGFGRPCFRIVEMEPGRIRIHDGIGRTRPGDAASEATVVTTPDGLRQVFGLTLPFSRGYGAV
jgi:hypothetical protein